MRRAALVLVGLLLAGCGSPAPGPEETVHEAAPAADPRTSAEDPRADPAASGNASAALEAPVQLLDQTFEFDEQMPAASFEVPAWADVLAVNVTEILLQPCYAALPWMVGEQPSLRLAAPDGWSVAYDVSSVVLCRMAAGPRSSEHNEVFASPGTWQVQPSGRGAFVALRIIVTAVDQA